MEGFLPFEFPNLKKRLVETKLLRAALLPSKEWFQLALSPALVKEDSIIHTMNYMLQ